MTCPFPGGVVRSGSQVGSRYQAMAASTNHLFCPTLKGVDFETDATDLDQPTARGTFRSLLDDQVNCVYEIVIDGTCYQAVGKAIALGIRSAAGAGVVSMSAANYGGKLGKYHYHLQELLSEEDASQNGQSYPQGVR